MNASQKIKAMLLERTGTSLYDSGGAYGRHWQKNRKRDLKGEPELTLNFQQNRKGFLETVATASLYHQLRKSLQYDHSMQGDSLLCPMTGAPMTFFVE